MGKFITYSEICCLFEKEGYCVLDAEGQGIEKRFNIQDKGGYRYFTSWLLFKEGIKEFKKQHDTIYVPRKYGPENPHTLHNISLWLKENNKPFILDSGEYKSLTEPTLFFQCNVCHNKWYGKWTNIYHSNSGCPYCCCKKICFDNSLAKARPDLLKEWNYEKNGNITPYDVSPRSDRKFWWKCSVCGHEWITRIGSRNGRNKQESTNCPRCCRSIGELEVEKILVKYFINFETQYSFEDCKFVCKLFFDFYLPDKNCCIEFNGRQHYEYNAFWRTYIKLPEDNFEKQVLKDNIKEDFCMKKGILFIKIPYWDFNRIEEILVRELRLPENN